MAFIVKQSAIEEDIVNEKNEKIGTITFDPRDAEVYKKFLKLVDALEEYLKKEKSIGKLENIKTTEFKNIQDFEKYKGIFTKLDNALDNYLTLQKQIESISDEIFGNVSEPFKTISNSIDPYIDLINWATPYFQKSRENKINQYLDDKEEVL